MKVKELYESSGKTGDWELRNKIERAVMQNYTIHWDDDLTDEAAEYIANAYKEYSYHKPS